MNFMFEWQEQYLTKYCSEILFCYENRKFISSSQCVMFFLLYKHTGDGVFDDFPKISNHFPKISEDFPKLLRRPDERSRTFSKNFRKFPKMSEDFRILPTTFEEDPKMFWWYSNEFKYNLRDKLDITELVNTFTCEDIISSHVRISYHFYQFVTTRYTTDFYIIKYINNIIINDQ